MNVVFSEIPPHVIPPHLMSPHLTASNSNQGIAIQFK